MINYVAYEIEEGKPEILVGEYESFEKLKYLFINHYPTISNYPPKNGKHIFVFKEKVENSNRNNLGTYCYFIK